MIFWSKFDLKKPNYTSKEILLAFGSLSNQKLIKVWVKNYTKRGQFQPLEYKALLLWLDATRIQMEFSFKNQKGHFQMLNKSRPPLKH